MDRQELLLKLSTAQFAMWELHMFLDTHPNNCEAIALKEKYEKQFNKLKDEFEEKFGPITMQSGTPNDWIENPWPWDYEEDGD